MSKYYKIVNREDSARIGILTLSKNIISPFLIEPEMYDSLIYDIGSFWINNDSKNESITKINVLNNMNSQVLVILPRFQFSASYPMESFFKKQSEIYKNTAIRNIISSFPTAMFFKSNIEDSNSYHSNDLKMKNTLSPEKSIVLCKQMNKICPDIYILGNINSLENNAYKFLNSIINIKKFIPFDSALWLPNLATPINIALLVYLGADIFDLTRISFYSLNDIYFTNNSYFNINSMKHLPCCCSICKSNTISNFQSSDSETKFKLLLEHNTNILK